MPIASKTLTLAASLFACLALAACDNDSDTTVDNRTAGEKVKDAGEKTGEVLDKAAEKTGEVVGKITDDTVALTKQTKEQGERAAANAVPSDAEAIHDVIAQAAEAAMTPGKFAEVVERLSDADRKRIGDEYAKKEHGDYNDIAGQAAAAWKKAYGRDFDVKDETATFGGASSTITLGGDGKTATTSMAGLSIPFVREPSGWRIDAPDVLNGEGLKNALIARFGTIASGATALPKDETEGHRFVAKQVIEAIMTTDQPKSPAVPLR
jgi:hypothetical protein